MEDKNKVYNRKVIIMEKKLYTSPDKKLCGVCGGIADYFNIDPTLVRIIVSAVSLLTAVIPALFIYFIVALVIPKAPENYYQLFNNTSKRLKKSADKRLFGVCGGIAEYFSIDSTIVRLVFVFSFLVFGYGLGVYIVCAAVMPRCEIENGYYQQNGQQNYNAQQNYNTQAYWNAQQQPQQSQQPQNGPENN